MATDAAGAGKPARTATRSTRASQQERKEILEAAQALPLVAAVTAATTSSENERPDTPDETVSTSDTKRSGGGVDEPSVARSESSSTSSSSVDLTAARRSGRRAGAPARTPTGTMVAASDDASSSTVAAAASSSTEATKGTKEDCVEPVATGPTATDAPTTKARDVVSDASTESASDSDAVVEKRGAHKRVAREDDAATASLRAAKVAKESTAVALGPNESLKAMEDTVPTAPTAATPLSSLPATATVTAATAVTTPTNAANDLKRSADVLTDASSDAAASGVGGPVVPKAKRVRKTREEKLSILAFVDDGGTHVAAAEKFGVSRTAVTKMVKERDIIMSGLSGKQHAAANGAPQAVAVALGGTSQHAASPSSSTALPTDGIPAPPTRKTRASSSASGAAAAVAAASRSQQTVDGAPHPKAKRVRKTNEEKLLILEFVERGGSQGAAAEKFGVSRTAVTKMVKEREAITAQVMSGKSNHRKVLQYQHKLSIIEDMLYKWQVQVENDAPNLKITGDLLQSKAVEFRDKILAEWKDSLEPEVVQSLSDFKASNGWLHRYLQRRNLRTASKREYHRRPSPNAIPPSPSDPFNMNVYLADITQRLRAVPVQCIWNMDEIALLPKACTAPPATDAESEHAPSDRMTIALMVNAAGEKFKPEVLISDAYMEQIDVLQKAHPNLILTSQHYAWQDTTALALYLHTVSSEAKLREETWFIIMDASPSHMEFAQLVDPAGSFEQGYRFENLVLLLLPPQAIAEQQPVHQGVSRVFKAAYRQSMLTAVMQKWNQTERATPKVPFDLHTQIDASDEMAWVSLAWTAVPAALVRHCWVRNGLLSDPQLAQISQDNSRAIEAELFRSLTDTVSTLVEQDDGVLAHHLGMSATSALAESGSPPVALLDRVNALIALDNDEPTERKMEMSTTNSQVITETDANGDLRALV